MAPRGAPELAFWRTPLIASEATKAPPRQKYNLQMDIVFSIEFGQFWRYYPEIYIIILILLGYY